MGSFKENWKIQAKRQKRQNLGARKRCEIVCKMGTAQLITSVRGLVRDFFSREVPLEVI